MPRVTVELAPQGSRSKCRNCKLKIKANNVRVGVPVYRAGGLGVDLHHPATMNKHWMHAVCCLRAEVAPDSRCKCMACGDRVQRETLRIGVRGETLKSTQWHHPACAGGLFDREQLAAAGIDLSENFNPWWVSGYGLLAESLKLEVARLFGTEARLGDAQSQREHEEREEGLAAAEEAKWRKSGGSRKRKGGGPGGEPTKSCRFG